MSTAAQRIYQDGVEVFGGSTLPPNAVLEIRDLNGSPLGYVSGVQFEQLRAQQAAERRAAGHADPAIVWVPVACMTGTNAALVGTNTAAE